MPDSYFLSLPALLGLGVVYVLFGVTMELWDWFCARYQATLRRRYQATLLYRRYQVMLRRHYQATLRRQEHHYQAMLRRRDDLSADN
jgi:hypothetical protein